MGIYEQITGKKNVTFHYVDTEGAEPEVLSLDAALSETHTAKATATEHPIEDGSDVSDHVIFKGYSFDVNGIVSDDPITLLGTVLGNVSGVVGSLVPGGAVAGALATGLTAGIGGALFASGKGKPSKNAYDIFTYLMEEGIPVTVVTGLRSYVNMIIENLTVPRNSANSNSLTFTASMKQISVAYSEVVEVPEKSVDPTASHSAAKKKSLGSRATKGASGAESGKGSSILAKVFL